MISSTDVLNIIRQNEIKIDIAKLDHDVSLMDQGLDSLDMVSILFALEENFEIRIPEEDIDQGKLASINSMVEYINRNQH